MKISVGLKLTAIFVIILIVGLGTTSYFAYQGISKGMVSNTTEELTAINDLKQDQIDDYFKDLKDSIKYLSNFNILKKELPNLANGFKQGTASEEYQTSLEKITTGVSYFIDNDNWNDLYLIDTKGNVVYSSARGKDYATNLISGPYQDSSLAKAYQQGKEQLSFTDFKYYKPADSQVAFLSAPVIAKNGQMQGVAVLEFSAARINEIMNRESGLGEHGESYLVAADHLMRSDSKIIDSNTIGNKKINNSFVDKVTAGESGVGTYINYQGDEVLGSYMPVDVIGENWGLFVEVDKDHIMQPVNELLKQIFYIALAIIIGGVIITVIVVKLMISNPIHKVRDALSSVAEKDLTTRINHSANDELGKMSVDLNRTIEELNNTINKLNEIVVSVNSASQKLASENGNLSSRTQDTASSLEEISATIEEISASMEEIASHASTVNQLSEENLKAIKEGADIIDDTKEEIEAMDNLSSKISEIIVIINDIAAQTKLLSMNAAIEAAKADQNGQGFAVVASEVGQLADQTSNSAKEINTLIQNIINGINESSEQINVVDEMFDQIVENSSKVYRGIDEISSSTEEQSSAVEQMQEALTDLNVTTQKNTNLVEEIASSSEDLSQDAEEMRGIVDEFKLRGKNNDLMELLENNNLEELSNQDINISLEQLKKLSN